MAARPACNGRFVINGSQHNALPPANGVNGDNITAKSPIVISDGDFVLFQNGLGLPSNCLLPVS